MIDCQCQGRQSRRDERDALALDPLRSDGAMTAEVTLYIDFRSPYSYLATMAALALERDFAV
jgi:hypothetical protein